jgi:glycosyl transferase family 87
MLVLVALVTLLTYVVSVNDSVAYWSAARLLLTGGNPYSPEEMLRLETSAGWSRSTALPTWNPPWTLVLFLPLGFSSYKIAQALWFLVNILILVSCSKALSRVYGNGEDNLAFHVTFIPALVCLLVGQTSLFVLLGFVYFLRLVQQKQDTRAGVAAALLAVKPQLIYLFWPALLLWAIVQRRTRILIGFAAMLLVASLVVLWLNPAVFSFYMQKWRLMSPLESPVHTIGTLLRSYFGWQRHWLAYLPSVCGLFWFVLRWGYWKRLDWRADLPTLLVVSLATTSYALIYDQAVLLIAVQQWIQKAASANNRRRSVIMYSYIAINLAELGFTLAHYSPFAFCWFPLLYLCLYVAAQILTPYNYR